ncbi:EAL domain-containing protein [Pelosinus sp. sgz500959]|uniref:sensor domain-containing protein n=1 Tax=Pelosinus sp. sgz500959 TaxID=3242472 RepID=UPI00366EBA1D
MLMKKLSMGFLRIRRSHCQRHAKIQSGQNEEFFRTVVTNTPIIIYALDCNGIFTLSEGLGLTKLGLYPGEVVGQSALIIYQDYPEIIEAIQRALSGEMINLEHVIKETYFDNRMVPIVDEAGCVYRVIGVALDITERKRAEEELEQAYQELTATEEKLREQFKVLKKNSDIIEEKDKTLWALFNNMHDAFALYENVCDEHGNSIGFRYLAVNKSFERMMGVSASELVKDTVYTASPSIKDYWLDIYDKVAQTGIPQSFVYYSPKWKKYYSMTTYSPQPGQIAVLSLDVTEERHNAELVRHLAYHDSLTGLANRLYFREKITQAIDYASQHKENFTIMFLDLNDFKRINDTFGHSAGDEFLKVIANRLKTCLPENYTIARMGGDEFTVIIPAIGNVSLLSAIAEKIIDAIKEPWSFGVHDFYIGISIGMAVYPRDGDDIDALLKCADIAMYTAKKIEGNSYHFYTEELHAAIIERVSLENALHQAIERNEFILHYQPQVDQFGKLIGVEALIRWQHPTRGLLYPGDFLDLAEEIGIMIPGGEWVLRTACAQNAAWQKAGYLPITMAVNVSATQFQHPNFLENLKKILAETELSPELLEVEITETIAMTNVEVTSLITNALQSMGIRQALDDFGTGYSSLKYLKIFNIDVLKIDKSFVQDIECDCDNDAIVKAIIALAQNLKLEVIAEGVETQQQYNYLKQLGCQKMQGYYFSRPVSGEQIEEILREMH